MDTGNVNTAKTKKNSVFFAIIIIVSVILILAVFLAVFVLKGGGTTFISMFSSDEDNQATIEEAEKQAKLIYSQKTITQNNNKVTEELSLCDIFPELQQKGYRIEFETENNTISADNVKVKINSKEITTRIAMYLDENIDAEVVVDMGENAKYYLVVNGRSYEIQKQNGNVAIAKESTKRKSSEASLIPTVTSVTSKNESVVKASVNGGKIALSSNSAQGETALTIVFSNNLAKSIAAKVQADGIEKDGKSFTWSEISEISKQIVKDANVNSSSATAGPYTVNKKEVTLAVGDIGKVLDTDGNSYNVRILGFKTDDLADGSGKAGISFEFISSLGNYIMNSINSTEGGWASTDLRAMLNGGTKHDKKTVIAEDAARISTLSNYKNIKSVKKNYIPVYNVEETKTCNDKLWLLASGEIWDNGYKDGARGVAITDESTEHKQYLYYKMYLKDTKYNVQNDVTKKPNVTKPVWWWLRSPLYGNMYTFCYVLGSGIGSSSGYSSIRGAVFPGFCI